MARFIPLPKLLSHFPIQDAVVGGLLTISFPVILQEAYQSGVLVGSCFLCFLFRSRRSCTPCLGHGLPFHPDVAAHVDTLQGGRWPSTTYVVVSMGFRPIVESCNLAPHFIDPIYASKLFLLVLGWGYLGLSRSIPRSMWARWKR